MKILNLHFFPGRNIYSHRPVMKMLLDLGSAKDFCTNFDPYFAEKLLRVLPGLLEHTCSRGYKGGFIERVREGTYLGHVVEHIFLELQSQAAIGTNYGKTRTYAGSVVEIIAEYRCRQAAEFLAQSAVKIVEALLDGKHYDPKADIEQAKSIAAQYLPGPSTAAILEAAKKRQIPFQQLAEGTSLYRLGTGKYQKRILASISENTGCIAVDIACNKPLTKRILQEHGLPVPCGFVVESLQEALKAAQQLGYPVVIKPDNGNQGKGVSLNLQSSEEVKRAYALAAAYSPRVMIESYLEGRHYRLLVVNKRLVAAAERIPALVIGDGIHTVAELIARENQNPLRGDGHEKPLTKIPVDQITKQALHRQGLTLESVVPRGQKVLLRNNANLSTGGTACDVTAEVHPKQAELAVRAAALIGLDIAGVDLVMQDIKQPPEQQEGGIIEINAAPGLRMHLYPSQGAAQDVGAKIIEQLFPAGQPVRIPVFSITGTNGKTTTARMLEFVLRKHGLYTGLSCTDGLYYNGSLAKTGDLTGPAGANAVLSHPDVEVAILETARGGIIRRGLGYDRADVAVICNIRPDHLGQDGIETLADLIYVKSLVAEAVYDTGTVVLNADDAHVHELAERVWAEIIYFSTQADSITVRRHLGNGGRAVFLRRGAILAAWGNRVTLVGRTRDFAVTHNGYAQHQIENLLSALAACWGYGIPIRQAAAYLREFASSPQDNPGRANFYRLGDFNVLVDYGHNPDGFAKIGQFVKKLKPNRTLAVIGVPGDRRNDLVLAAGAVAAKYFDFLFIKEDEDLRGRKPGEIADLLKKGAMQAGKDETCIKILPAEQQALQEALNMAAAGDLVIVFYEKIDVVLSTIFAFRKQSPLVKKTTLQAKIDSTVALS
ncbi:MAG: cyanophycin synthetase [Firmicutes bacterium]|nr:cyanophycin synthetase [Bacillota bacterium]